MLYGLESAPKILRDEKSQILAQKILSIQTAVEIKKNLRNHVRFKSCIQNILPKLETRNG